MAKLDWEKFNQEIGYTPTLPTQEEDRERNKFGVPIKRSKGPDWEEFNRKLSNDVGIEREQDEVNRDWWDWMGQGISQGGSSAYASIGLTSWLHGGMDNADTIAEHFQDIERPDYAENLSASVERVNEAEGFLESTIEVGRFLGKAITNPKATSYLMVEQLANMVPTMGGALAGAGVGAMAGTGVLPVIGTISGATVGAIVGMSAGTTASTIGEKGFEMLRKYGADMKSGDSIRQTFNNPEFRAEALKKGYLKGAVISAVDAFTFRMGGKLISAPGKALEKSIQKEFAEAGVEEAAKKGTTLAQLIKQQPKLRDNIAGHVETYLAAGSKLSDKSLSGLQKAATTFAKKSTTLKKVGRGAAFVGMETIGEGVGEYAGEFAAEGEGKLGDAVLESITSLGQSAATVALSKTLSGATKGTKQAVREIRARQIDKLSKGRDSGLDPSKLNEAQRRVDEGASSDALNRQVEIDEINTILSERDGINPDISELENYIEGLESRESLDSAVDVLEGLNNYTEYKTELRSTLGNKYGDEVVLHVAVTPEDKVLLEKESPTEDKPALSGYIIGSLDEKGAPTLPNTETVRVTVPIQDIVGRSNSSKGQFVVRAEKVKPSAIVTKEEEKKTSQEKTLLNTAKKRIGEISQEEELEKLKSESLEEEAKVKSEDSKKTDPTKLTRSAVRQNQTKLESIPTIPEIRDRKTGDGRKVTKPFLAKVVVDNNIPLNAESDRGNVPKNIDIDSLRDDVGDYRNALESPNSMKKLNIVLGKQGYSLKQRGAEKRLILVDKEGSVTELDTVRVQDKTIDEYLDLTDKLSVVANKKLTQKLSTSKEKKSLERTVDTESKRFIDLGPVRANLDIIEERFVTRGDGVVSIDEDGLQEYVEKIKTAREWKAKDLTSLDQGIRRLRKESEIATKPTEKATVVVGIRPSEGVTGLKKVGKLVGTKLREFHRKAANLTRTGERDELLGKITKIFAPGSKRFVKGAKGKVEPSTVRTLTKASDSDTTARVYALSNILIYFQDDVSWSRPDASLDVAATSTVLNAHLRTSKPLNESQFGKLYKDVQRIVGEDTEIVRIDTNEFVVKNETINKSQFARRMGRLQGKRGKTYGLQAEFFTSRTETISHDWASEPSGESIRNQIRDLGFSDLLSYIDTKRDEYLQLAEEVGANVAETRQQGINFEQTPATEDTPQPVGPPVPKGKVRASVAHHGNAVDLEGGKFDLNFIGTGEGAQAFGWGIYFAERLNVAKFYRDSVGRDQVFIGEEPRSRDNPVHEVAYGYYEERRIFLRDLVGRRTNALEKETDSLTDEIDEFLSKHEISELAFPSMELRMPSGRPSMWEGLSKKQKNSMQANNFWDDFDVSNDGVSSYTFENKEFNTLVRRYEENFQKRKQLRGYLPLIGDWRHVGYADNMKGLGLTEESVFPFAMEQVRKGLGDKLGEDWTTLPEMPSRREFYESALEYAENLSSFADVPPISRRRVENLFTVDIDDGAVGAMLDFDADFLSQPPAVIHAVVNTLRQIEERVSEIDTSARRNTGAARFAISKPLHRPPNVGSLRKYDTGKPGELAIAKIKELGITLDPSEESWLIWQDSFFSGGKVYNAISHAFAGLSAKTFADLRGNKSGQREASLTLAKEGVPGLKFLDNASRGKKDGTRNFVVWDQKVLDTLDMNPPPVRGSVIQGKPASSGFFNTRLRKELTDKFGEEGIINLERDGVLRIIPNSEALPAQVRDRFENYDMAAGLYDETTKTAYLIADRVPKGKASNILMHEVGVHYGLKQMLGADRFSELMTQVLEKKDDKQFAPYFKQVADAYGFLDRTGDDTIYSEDFIEEVIAKIAEDPQAQDISILQDMWKWVREFLAKMFKGKTLTTYDIQSAVRGALKQSMQGESSNNEIFSDRVLASLTGELEKAKEMIFNSLKRSDDRYAHLPLIVNKSLSNPEKNREFSAVGMTNAQKKKAQKELISALDRIESSFKKYSKGTNLKIHFSTNTPNSERLVHVYNPDTDGMLTFRFSFDSENSTRMQMLTPVVEFSDMANETINKADIDKALFLLKEYDLKKHSALSLYVDYRLGSPIPASAIPGLDQRAGRDSYKTYIKRLSETDPARFSLLLDAEQISVDSGVLRQRVTSNIVEGKVRASIPENSTRNVSDAGKALVSRTTGRTKRNSLLENIELAKKEGWLYVTQGAVDRYRSIKNKLGDDGHKAWMMMHLSDNVTNLMHSVLHFGSPVERKFGGKFDGYDVNPDSKGLIDILQDLGGETDTFLTWVVGNRAEKLSKQDREKNYTEADIKEMKLLSKGRMEDGRNRGLVYMKTMRDIAKFQGSILDMAMNAGVISKEDRAALITDFYLPFYRQFEQQGTAKVRGPSMTGDFVNIRDVVRDLKGSELDVNDVLENLMMNWAALMNASLKNRAGVAAVEAAERLGVAHMVSEKEGAQIDYAKRKGAKEKYNDYVYILKDGKKIWYKMEDPMVLQSLLALNWDSGSLPGIKALSTFKRMFTYGVTASPAFKIRNLIRDSLHSVAVSDLSYNIFGNVKEGLATSRESNKIYRSMITGGGAFEFGFLHDDPTAIRRIIKYGTNQAVRGLPNTEQGVRGRILDTSKKSMFFLRKGWDKYQAVGNMMENANRISLYMKRVGKVGHMQANFEARDLLNFSSHGNWIATQYLISGISFINARAQGLSKLARSGKDNQQRSKLMVVVGTTILASVLYELGMGEDEEYKQLENWVRDTYWPVKLPGENNWFLIPKPFEIGAMASVAQRFTQQFIDNSVDPMFFASRVYQIIHDQLAFDFRPQIAKPVIEVLQNKDQFRDRQIESLGWQISNKSKTLMEHKYTSSFASGLSRALDVVTPGGTIFSPVQIDHLVKGYFGWLGATIVGSADILFSDENEATKRLDEYYGLFPAGTLPPSFVKMGPLKNTKHTSLFYEQLKEMNQIKADYNHYKARGMDKELRELLTDKGDVLVYYKLYNRMQRKISKLNKSSGIISDDEFMTPDQKRIAIDKNIEAKNDIAAELIGLRIADEKRVDSAPKGKKATPVIKDSVEDNSVQTDQSVENNLYKAVFSAEFRGLNRMKPFIRTRTAPKGGSSAYGPLQITRGLMKSAKSQLTLTKKENEYVERFIEQGNRFLEFGNEPNKKGYDRRYDYGGEGDLTTNEDKRIYKQVAKKLLRLVWDQADGDWRKFVNAWRYGEGSNKDVEKMDKEYFTAFTNNFRT